MLVLLIVLVFVLVLNNVYGLKNSSLKCIRNKQIRLNAIDVIDPSYNLGLGSAAIGLISAAIGNLPAIKNGSGINLPAKILGGIFFWFSLFAAFFSFQSTTLRFEFDETSFALVKSSGERLGENVIVGGENKWIYSSFVNWAFLPSEKFPILVYFKETQTPKEKWVEAPIVVDEAEGQVHYFPAISRVDQLKSNFEKNNCAKLDESKNNFKTQIKGSML